MDNIINCKEIAEEILLEVSRMDNIINCKEIAEEILLEASRSVQEIVEQTGDVPRLAVIIVGDDPASQVYVRNKIRRCEAVGIESNTIRLSADITEAQLLSHVAELNLDPHTHGILVQMPLPHHINEDNVINSILATKDVDGLHPFNQAQLMNNKEPRLDPCTPAGVMRILNKVYDNDISGGRAVVIGRSRLFGKPMVQMLLNANATVTTCHSRTVREDMKEITRGSDIVISAIGKPHYFDGSDISDWSTVIDVGINRLEDGSLVGDVNTQDVIDQQPNVAITPVPGGVGILTTAMLMLNTIKAYKIQKGAS